MRISNRNLIMNQLRNMSTTLGNFTNSNNRMTSGRKFDHAYENVADATRAMRLRKSIRDKEFYITNIRDARGRLNSAEDAIQTTVNILRSVTDRVEEALNGTVPEEDRKKIATEISNLQEEVLALMNTTYTDHPVFSGSGYDKKNVAPFQTQGNKLLYHGMNVDQLYYNKETGKYEKRSYEYVDKQAVDENGKPRYAQKTVGGNLVYENGDLTKPVYDLSKPIYEPVLDKDGKGIPEQKKDANGKLVYEQAESNGTDGQTPGTLLFEPLRYADGSIVYKQATDGAGKPLFQPLLDENNNQVYEQEWKVVGYWPTHDETGSIVYYDKEATKPVYGKPEEDPDNPGQLLPVYDAKGKEVDVKSLTYTPKKVLVNTNKPVYTKIPIYSKDPKDIVYTKIPVDDKDKPVYIDAATDDDGNFTCFPVVDENGKLYYNQKEWLDGGRPDVFKPVYAQKTEDVIWEPIRDTQNYLDVGIGHTFKQNADGTFSINPETVHQFTYSGVEVFGAGKTNGHANNVYTFLGEIVDSMNNNNMDLLGEQLNHIKDVRENLLTSITEIGVRTNFLDNMEDIHKNDLLNFQTRQKDVEAVDLPQEAMNNKNHEMAWMVTLQMGSKILPSSLFDFLR